MFSRLSGSRSRTPEAQPAHLENFRVLDQSKRNPFETPHLPPTSRTFRVAAFVFHLGLSLLESPRSRNALGKLISETYKVSPLRTRKTFIWTGNLQTDKARTEQLIEAFCSKCRANPPNITVSDRIAGEGLAQRLNWPGFLRTTNPDAYNPKWAAMLRLNKMLVDATVEVAEEGKTAAVQKYLFLLSLSVAHELVHLLMGYLFGSSDTDTPPAINYPRGGPNNPRGESGRFWEKEVFGCFIEAYYDTEDPMKQNQCGKLYGMLDGRRYFQIDNNTILGFLKFDFSISIVKRGERGQRVPQRATPMQDFRAPSAAPDYRGDLTEYFERVNRLPMQRVEPDDLVKIMDMAFYPSYIRQPVAVSSSPSRR